MSNSYWWVGKLTVVLLLLGVVAGVFTGAVGAADAELDTRDGPLTETNNSSAYTATSSGDDIGVQTTGSDDSSGDGTQVAITTVPEARSFGSDETMEIFVSASDADNDFAPVPGENLTVTVERPDGSVESFAVVTDQDGRAQVNYDLSATNRGDGEYTVTVSQDDGTESATVTPTVGPVVEPAHRTYEPILINKTTNVDFFVRNGEFGVPDQTVNVTVRNPAGTVTQQYQTTTDADGFANVSLTPGQTGQYEITAGIPETGDSETVRYTSNEILFYSNVFGLRDGIVGEKSSFGGYIEAPDGLMRNTDLVVEFRNQSDAVVVNKTTTTGPNGFFSIDYIYIGSSDYLQADIRTADGRSVTGEYVGLDDPSTGSGGGGAAVELDVTSSSGDVPPGESATFDISATDNGSAIANEEVNITARLGRDGAVLRSTTVTTDASGTAGVSIPVPTGIDGTDIEGTASFTYNGTIVEESFGTEVKKYDIYVDPEGGFYTAGLNVSVTAEYIANGTGAGGVPAQYTALLSGDTIGSYGTGQLVTDGTGHANETVAIPRSIPPYDATPSAHRYDSGFNGYRVLEVELPGTMEIDAPRENEFGEPVAAPGDTLTINFTTPNGTVATGLAYAEFHYGDSYQGGSVATAASTGANATLTVPEYAGDDDFVDLTVWAADSSGLFYTAETSIEVNGSSTSDDTPLDVSLSSSADIVTVGTNVTLTATATEPVEEYQWDLESDGVIDETTTSNNITGEAPEAGDYTITVTAVGTDGDTASATTNVTVVNESTQTELSATGLPGSGTETDPYIITNASELQAMEDDLDAHYQLGSDIDASATALWNNESGFDPVGDNPFNESTPPGFTGSFDGAGHTVAGLAIARPTEEDVGLFGGVGPNARIENVSMVEASVSGFDVVGALVARNGGTVQNVTVESNVTGTYFLGGVVGSNYGSVVRVRSHGAVTGDGYGVGGVVGYNGDLVSRTLSNSTVTSTRPASAGRFTAVGGVVGYLGGDGRVLRTESTGTVQSTGGKAGGIVGFLRSSQNVVYRVGFAGSVAGNGSVGGIVGGVSALNGLNSTIERAYVNGNVTAVPGAVDPDIGGVVGYNAGYVREAVVRGTVGWDGSNGTVGGAVGYNYKSVERVLVAANVTGGEHTGGIVGNNGETILNSTARGTVTGFGNIGGIAGSTSGPIQDSVAISTVTAAETAPADADTGGVVGANYVDGNISSTYWDESTTGQATSPGNGTGLTTSQMTGEAARTNMSGLPFDTVWEVQADDYPVLITLLESGDDGDSGSQTQVDVDPSDLPGSGTETDPYIITNASELQAIEDDLDAHYQLGSDIDATATALWNNQTGFDPISNTTVGFTGTFDGAGHNITGLTVDRPSAFDVGVFGVVKDGGVVANIALRDANVSGERRVGLLVGGVNLDGTVRSSTATGNVSGNTYVGGLAGSVNGGRLNTTGARASVGGVDGVGGLSGRIAGSGTVVRSEANSTVSGETEVGGFVGTMSSRMASVDEASAWGTVEGVTDVGGFAGRVSASSITRSAAAGTVSGVNSVGGFAGTVTNGPNGYDGDIENSFTLAAVEGASNGQDIAGFAGTLRNGSVARSYATGSVTGPSGQIGGLTANSTDSAVTDAYWDESATGLATSAGNGTGLITSQMTGEAARTNMSGLAFGTVWETQPDDHPTLNASQTGSGDELPPPTTENGLAVDGTVIYVNDDGTITGVNDSTDTIASQFAAPNGSHDGLAYGNSSLWYSDGIADTADGEIVELDPETGAVRSRINTSGDITALAYGNGSLWAVDITNNDVIEFSPAGAKRSTFDIQGPTGSTEPRALAYANESLWLGTTDTDTLYRFSPNRTLLNTMGPTRDYRGLAASGRFLLGPDEAGNLSVITEFETQPSAVVVEGCQVIDEPGTYALGSNITEDFTDQCIQIAANDVVFDGQGHTIDGVSVNNADKAVLIGSYNVDVSNVTVRNIRATSSDYGVRVLRATNVTVSDVETVDTTDNGVYIQGSSGVNVTDSFVTSTTNGFSILSSTNVTIAGTAVVNSETGIKGWGGTQNLRVTETVINGTQTGVTLSPYSDSPTGTVVDNAVIRNTEVGVALESRDDTIPAYDTLVRDTVITDVQQWTVYTEDSSKVALDTVRTGPNTEPTSMLTGTAQSAALRILDPSTVSDPPLYGPLSPVVQATNTTGAGTLNLTAGHLSSDDVSVANESLGLYTIESSTWESLADTTRGGRTLSATITNETTVAVLGEDNGKSDTDAQRFEVTGLTLPPSTGAGAPFTYTAEITNVGPVRGTQQVTASVGGQQVAVRNVTLNESASRTLAFRAQVDSAGTYEATVATDNETVGDPIEVTGQQFVVGHSTGDPHITTFDGAAYDFMAAGDYVLAHEPQGEMLVVARQKPVSGSVSVNNMTGAIINGTSVVIDAEASSPVSVDGQSITLAVGENRTVAGGDAEIIRHGSAYSLYVAGADGVVGPSDEHLTADVVGDRVDISLYLHENRTRAVEGLFGTINGTAADDIAFENGTALDRPLNPDQLYDGFRADWRVSSEASPFAADYYRSTFPENIVTLADLAESDRTKAEEILADTCLEPGTPQYRDALLDVALTGDSSYVASACRASDDDISDADGGSATTSIQPAEQTLTPGDTVTVNVTVDDVTDVYAASGLLSYNSSVLRAADVTRGGFLSQDGAETQLLVQSTNNTTGTVDFGITRVNTSSGQNGAGTVVQVEFVVADTAPAGAESQLALDSATLSDPSGNPISVTRRNASATVSDGLQLNASLASPVSYAGSPLQVRADGTGANVTQFAVNVARIGGVSATVPCAGGPACSEFVSVTPEQSSWNGSSYEPVDVNVTADTDTGETTTKTLSTTIRTAGDASGDGTVDIKDAAALGQSWRSTAGEADYAPEADLNQDGRVNIFDAVLLGNNWQDEATSPDTSPTASFVTENGQLTAKAVSNATIAGTTNLPPESTVEVRVSSDSSNPFVTAPSATVGGNGQFAVTIDLSDQTDGAEFTATVRYNSTELVSRTGAVVSE